MASYLGAANAQSNVSSINTREKAGMWANLRLDLVDDAGTVVESPKIGSIPFYESNELGKALIERMLKGSDEDKATVMPALHKVRQMHPAGKSGMGKRRGGAGRIGAGWGQAGVPTAPVPGPGSNCCGKKRDYIPHSVDQYTSTGQPGVVGVDLILQVNPPKKWARFSPPAATGSIQ